MIWHPLLLSVEVMDVFGFILLLPAAVTALAAAADWSPGSTDRRQIAIEIRTETAAVAVRWAIGILALSTLILVVGITLVLPHIVPGAMCGTGVIQATGGRGTRALIFRLIAGAVLYWWVVLDRIDRTHPEAPLTQVCARVLLAAFPLAVVALLDTARAVWALDTVQPVDCCAMVYDRVSGMTGSGGDPAASDGLWVGLFAASGTAMIAAATAVWLAADSIRRKAAVVQALLAPLWVTAASVTMVRVLAAYYYQVLNHHCPWCLFLPEHGLVGFPIFGALVAVLFEGPVAAIGARIADYFPALSAAVDRRVRSAGIRVVVFAGVFLILALLPALLWRVRHGIWMTGAHLT